MAEKKKKEKKEEGKLILERTYNVPLRKEWLKVAKYKRAKKAGKALKQFIEKHMKAEEVKIGKYLNLEIWKHGIKNPPHHVKVNVFKYENGLVMAELFGAPKEEKKKEKKEKKKPAKEEEKVVDAEIKEEEK